MEKEVSLQCLQKDIKIIESIKSECEKQFSEIIKTECKLDFTSKIIIDNNHYLDEENKDCFGGVILSCLDGRIKCINTLNSRIDMCF